MVGRIREKTELRKKCVICILSVVWGKDAFIQRVASCITDQSR